MVAQFRRVILSRNEVAAVLHKAARARGVPLGHIDVCVPAAVRALALYDDFADELTRILEGPHDETSVIMAGPIAMDALLTGEPAVQLPDMDSHRLMQCMIYEANDNSDLCGVLEVNGAMHVLAKSQEVATPERTLGPLTIPDDAWDIWQGWAALTYVPATDASRASGAGAGLTDND